MDGSNLLGEDGSPTLFTAGEEFGTVSRGDPVIQEMDAQAQHAANLTEETWRLEITADSFVGQPHATEAAKLGVERTRGGGNAVDLPEVEANRFVRGRYRHPTRLDLGLGLVGKLRCGRSNED